MQQAYKLMLTARSVRFWHFRQIYSRYM